MWSRAKKFQASEQIILKKLKKQLEFWHDKYLPNKRTSSSRTMAMLLEVLMASNSRFIMMMMMIMHNHQQGPGAWQGQFWKLNECSQIHSCNE